MGRPAHDLVGRRFSRLVVLQRNGSKYGKPAWLCRCDCGVEKIIGAANLKNGSTVSCGCYRDDTLKEASTTHGRTRHRLFNVWVKMMDRCYNSDHKYYKNYGGRGVRVVDRWHDVSCFVDDMFPSFIEGLTLERKDNEGHYSPGNCVWVSRTQQANNTRRNRTVVYRRREVTVAELSRETGVPYATLWYRITNGWQVNDAVGGQ